MFPAHNTTQYHQLALTRADALKSSFVHPDSSIGNRMQRNTESNIAQNRLNGFQGRLSAENAKATYVHCNCHVLNLCIVVA